MRTCLYSVRRRLLNLNDTPDEAMAATENAQNGVIDLTEDANVTDGVYTINIAEDYKFTCKKKSGNVK